jgi:hypothetical protein
MRCGLWRGDRFHKDAYPMTTLISKYEAIWGDDPRTLLAGYDYQRNLTVKLDALKPQDLDVKTVYEIVLWKLNRFPTIEADLLDELKTVAVLKPREHRKATAVLHKMLRCSGIALPMASTIFRFIRPSVFQIIDDRVYRIVHPGKAKYPAKPVNVNERYLATSSKIYFEYLDELHKLSSEKLPFQTTDRILYELDIKLGNKIGAET